MPTFEEMQRESSERLVSFAKHAKLSVRGALLDVGHPVDPISAVSCNMAVNFLITDYVALSAHKLRGEDARPLAQDIREPIEEMSAVLDRGINDEIGNVDKRRMALAIVNKAVLENTRAIPGNEPMEEVTAELNAVRGHEHATRSAFTREQTYVLVNAAHRIHAAAADRLKGISTLYSDDRTDNVAAFHEIAAIDDEMYRLHDACVGGASNQQRHFWEQGYHGELRELHQNSPQSDLISEFGDGLSSEEASNSNFDRPSSGASSPRSIDSPSDHGSASSGWSSSNPRPGYSSSDSHHRFSERDSSESDGILDPFPDDRFHQGQATVLRNLQAAGRLGASRSSRESSSAPSESVRSESWAGISPSAAPRSAESDRSSRSGGNRDVASPIPESVSTDEDTYVRNWPGASQREASLAYHSGDRRQAVENEREYQRLTGGHTGSPRVIPETRDSSPVVESPASPQRDLKRGRSETSDDDGSKPSNKRQQLMDGRAERSSRSRGL